MAAILVISIAASMLWSGRRFRGCVVIEANSFLTCILNITIQYVLAIRRLVIDRPCQRCANVIGGCPLQFLQFFQIRCHALI